MEDCVVDEPKDVNPREQPTQRKPKPTRLDLTGLKGTVTTKIVTHVDRFD